MPIPLAGRPGYFMAWGGEAEDSARVQGALAVSIPIFIGMMFLTLLIVPVLYAIFFRIPYGAAAEEVTA